MRDVLPKKELSSVMRFDDTPVKNRLEALVYAGFGYLDAGRALSPQEYVEFFHDILNTPTQSAALGTYASREKDDYNGLQKLTATIEQGLAVNDLKYTQMTAEELYAQIKSYVPGLAQHNF